MNGCFANLRMLCPCESSHLEPVLNIHIFRSVSLDVLYNVWFRYLNLCFANSHMFVPLGVLTVRTSLDTCSNLQVNICYIINAIVYEPMFCKLTYVCALASPHTFNLLFTCISSQVIHESYYRYSCIWDPVVQLASVCALARAHT